MSRLFEPFQIGELRLANRIIIAPMCQYSADEGSATDWHLIHLGHLALSGAAMLIVEATAVSPEGRITPTDLGLYSDANEAALARVLDAVRAALADQAGDAARPRRPQGLEPRAVGGRQSRLLSASPAAGAPSRRRRCRTSTARIRPRRSMPPACRRSATTSPGRPGAPSASASMRSRSMRRTAT